MKVTMRRTERRKGKNKYSLKNQKSALCTFKVRQQMGGGLGLQDLRSRDFNDRRIRISSYRQSS